MIICFRLFCLRRARFYRLFRVISGFDVQDQLQAEVSGCGKNQDSTDIEDFV